MTEEKSAVLITGAAQGIGKAIAERFSKDDAYHKIVCLDIQPKVKKVANEIDKAIGFEVDVSDQKRVFEVVDEIEESYRIDAAVNNAGISRYFWIEDLEPEEWDRVINVNLKGQYNIARATTPNMYKRKHGYLVNISSGAGLRGSISGGVHYSASKAGIFGLTKGLAKQLSPYVRVNCVVPGLIKTPIVMDAIEKGKGLFNEEGLSKFKQMTPLHRLGEPDEVARVVQFLCGEGVSYMTGSIINVEGGADLVPTQDFLMPEKSSKL